MSEENKETGKIWYKLRGALIVPLYLFSFLAPWGVVSSDNAICCYVVGAILFTLGWLIRIWAQIHLHYRLKTHKVLTLTGPYVYVRNPIYHGNTLCLVGITVMAGLLWFVPVMILGCYATYHMTVLYEESHLKIKYGEPYKEFLGRIPRWVPQFKGVTPAPSNDLKTFLMPSIIAELHILLLLVPFILWEIFKPVAG